MSTLLYNSLAKVVMNFEMVMNGYDAPRVLCRLFQDSSESAEGF